MLTVFLASLLFGVAQFIAPFLILGVICVFALIFGNK